VIDLVCSSDSPASCALFEFFLMSSHYGLSHIGGIVGMSTGIPYSTGPLFFKNLYNSDLIQDQVFGIKFAN